MHTKRKPSGRHVSPVPEWFAVTLSLLDESELNAAHHYYTVALPERVESTPLYDFEQELEVGSESWFDLLSAEKQAQVLELIRARLLDEYGLTLTFYPKHGYPKLKNGPKGGYRFEIAYNIPANAR